MGQLVNANPRIERFESGSGTAFAIADLTPAYENQVTSYRRGAKLFNKRTQLLIQDEIQLKEPSEIYWSFNTPAVVDILDDHTALLTLKGKYVLIRISANVEFTLTEDLSEKLSTSPSVPKETCYFYRKLGLRTNNVTELKLAVEFTPMLTKPNTETGEICKWRDMENWTVDTTHETGEIRMYDRNGGLWGIQAGETIYCEAETPKGFTGGSLIFALYDRNGNLMQVVWKNGEHNSELLRLQYTIDSNVDVSGYKVKAFLWEKALAPCAIPAVVDNE